MRRYCRGILKSTPSSKPPWRTPDHPPYSQMVEVALRALSEEGGSTESSISAFIQSTFTDLPWGHDRLLPYYLGKLVVSGEISSPSHDRYQLPLHHHQFLPSSSSLVRGRGRHLYRTNPSSYPTFYPLRSNPPRRRGRSRLSSSRGKGPKDPGEGMQPLQLEQERPRRRGRPRIKEGAAGQAATRMLVPLIRRSRGSRSKQDGSRVRNLSLISSFSDGGGGSAALDNLKKLELIHDQSCSGKAQPLLPPDQFSSVKCLPFGASGLPEFPEHCQVLPFHNVDEGYFSSEISAFSNDKVRGSGTRVLGDIEQPEQAAGGEGQPFVAAEFLEHSEGQFSLAREAPLLSRQPVKLSSFFALEVSEHMEEHQEKAPSSLIHESSKISQEQTSPKGLPLLSPEKHEIDDHGPEKSEDGLEKLSPGKGTALVAFEFPYSEEIGSHEISAKQKKARQKRRRLRLWFEG